MKKINKLWRRLASGVLVPAGVITDVSSRVTSTYLDLKDKAVQLEALFSENGIELAPTSDLVGLIANSRQLWERWFMNQHDKLNMSMVFKALHLHRITEAVLPLKEVSDRRQYLLKLCNGSLDFFKREKSLAKDILWELEVWSTLKGKLPNVRLHEPPDIVVDFEESNIGVACKKIYSEKHVQNVLSQAVSQIEREYDVGIVAVNIDDLIPADQVLKAMDQDQMRRVIQKLNEKFIHRHERHFRKYLSTGRLISAIVSSSVITDVEAEKTRLNNSRQWAIWTIPGLSAEKGQILQRFYNYVMQ